MTFNSVIDLAGVAIGIASFVLLFRSFRRGPEVYERPLRFFLAGLAFIVVSFLVSFAISVWRINHEVAETFHHLLLMFAVSFFVVAARRLFQISR